VLDDMSRWELAPNAETFTVAMEVCAAAAKRSTHPVASETIRRRILALFDAMNAPGLALDAPTDPTATSLSAYGLKDDDDDEEEDNDDEEDGDDGSRMPNSQGSPSTKERHSRRGHSKQPLPNMEAFTLALEAAAKNGRWQRAVKLMRSMTSAAATTTTTTEGPSSSVESVHLLGDEGGPFVSRAAAFITQEHWANVISACARARPPRWREALALLDEMRHSSDAAAPHVVLEGSPPFSSPSPSSSSSSSSSPPPPALLPDTVCYNAALSALARAGRWQEALSLLVEMRIQFERYGPGTYFSSNENAAHGRPTGLPASSSAASMRFDSCYDVQTFNTVREAIQECQFMPEVPGSCINVSSFLARR
jgi:pentatricopeptide repeat protein